VDSIMLDLERPLKEPEICCICKQICEALEFLHRNLVIHRDLKAGNVLLSADGTVKLGLYVDVPLHRLLAILKQIGMYYRSGTGICCCIGVWQMLHVLSPDCSTLLHEMTFWLPS